MSSAKFRQFFLDLNVLVVYVWAVYDPLSRPAAHFPVLTRIDRKDFKRK